MMNEGEVMDEGKMDAA
jgi:hypothetical protein